MIGFEIIQTIFPTTPSDKFVVEGTCSGGSILGSLGWVRTCPLYAIYRRDDSDQISGSVGMIFPISAVFRDLRDFSAVFVRIISPRSENVGMIFPISAVLRILEDYSAVLVESCQNHLSCKSRTVDMSSFPPEARLKIVMYTMPIMLYLLKNVIIPRNCRNPWVWAPLFSI